jgi:hypothetical protein
MNEIEQDKSTKVDMKTEQTNNWLDYFNWQIPVGVLLITLFLTNIFQFSMLLEQKKQLAATKQQVDQALPRAELVRNKLDGLARDIVELAKTNQTAKTIQEELKIQIADNASGVSLR